MIAIAALAPALVIAPAAGAQSAGDDQYQDPIVGGDDGDQDSQPQADPGGDTGGAPITPSTGAQAPSPGAVPAEPSSALPQTGGDAAVLAALGLALLMAGALARPRAGERAHH